VSPSTVFREKPEKSKSPGPFWRHFALELDK
jgi:hypothetical protein